MTEFKRDFSSLLLRYAALKKSIDEKTPDKRLSNQQILDLIHDTLRETLDINLQTVDEASLKTPANDIIITTPDAPDVLKMDYNFNNSYRVGLLPLPSHLKYIPNNLPNVCKIHDQTNDNPDNIEEVEENKGTESSDNSQNSENKAEETLKGPEEEQKSENVQNSEPSQEAPEGPTDVRDAVDIYNKVEQARLQIKTAESTIEEIREMLRPNIPNRRLSVIMDMPPITRRSAEKRRHSLAAAPSSTSMRTIHRAHQRRLSLLHNQEEFPVTPTTTRPNLASTPTLSTSSATKKPPAPPPSSASKSVTKSANRSMSLGTLHEVNNNHIKSSVANVSISETTKSHLPKPNPKYAHIQSTIPKTSGLPVKRFSKG
ncbi:uncharacterized protein LOC106655045 isoform X1 [Trichogramma pretiosum]|uniref:uncharacterized protein LOC106655045 isoform X1 n=1 Tax=Trichogramma pretiosum TaxID=7493 RepID=UPI0006C9B6A1|nr:uncharacterized protein LOC106655045 isoform X1 [Trichogramma pretiosum]